MVNARYTFSHDSFGRQKKDRTIKILTTDGLFEEFEQLRRDYGWGSVAALCECILLAFLAYQQGTESGQIKDLLNDIFGDRKK